MDFFDSLDVVLSAVDGLSARDYLSGRCIVHGKPLIDSATQGSLGTVKVMLPHVTEPYTFTPVSLFTGGNPLQLFKQCRDAKFNDIICQTDVRSLTTKSAIFKEMR